MFAPSPFTKTAIDAAKQAGHILQKNFGKTHAITKKEGVQNFVTESDIQAEQTILQLLKKKYPSHGFLAEESGCTSMMHEITWVIDPLDGTVNFARNIPHFAVSIAAVQDSAPILGVVFQPITGELFVAERGKGAFLQGKQISVSSVSQSNQGLFAVGFPYNVYQNPLHCIDAVATFLHQGVPIRRLGSAALDLAYVAHGRFDAYWETELHPWDIAAGILLVQEAGGMVSRWDNTPHPVMKKSDILASNSTLHLDIAKQLRTIRGTI